jgi:hypothetical protein
VTLNSRLDRLEGKNKPKPYYDFHYLIYVRPDGSPYDASAKAQLADALEARSEGYSVQIKKHTLPSPFGDPWAGLTERLARYQGKK